MSSEFGTRTLAIIAIATSGLALTTARSGTQSQGIPKTINYQGRLTLPSGTAVADGTHPATFELYDVLTGGTPLWTESKQVSSMGGVFQTTLGSVNSLGGLAFDKQYWLSVQIDGKTLTPRQALASVPYALRAQIASEMAPMSITTNMLADGAVTEQKLAAGLAVPIGTVVSWWGDSAQVPTGWKLCDGTVVNDANSPLNGKVAPDLRNKFVRGATGDVRTTNPTGGADTHSLTIAELAQHSHGITDPGHAHRGYHNRLGEGEVSFETGANLTVTTDFQTTTQTVPAQTGISVQNTGSGQAFSTVPAYAGLVYIMRVR